MNIFVADYREQRQAFYDLVKPDRSERILLYQGESGCGKTSLLRACEDRLDPTLLRLQIDLRGSAFGVSEFFSRSGRVLKWDKMQQFTRTVAEHSGQVNIKIDRNWLVGINNKIQVVLKAEDLAASEERQVALTEAWFTDIDALGQIVLVIIDTYDQATTEMAKWVGGPFLARVALTDALRVVIAGVQVPPANNVEWGNVASLYKLEGITSPEDWLPIMNAMQRRAPAEPPETYLRALCDIYRGSPESIMKIIEGFPPALVTP
jgi:hypothetical protein